MNQSPVRVEHLTMKYGERLIQQDLNFEIPQETVFIVMGGSGCGKSTLLRHLIGQVPPAEGKIYRYGKDYWASTPVEQEQMMRGAGILYQNGALWSSMTLAENIALPLKQFTTYSETEIRELCEYKLSLVGLAGRGGLYPSEISGGMRKRAGLARAMALDPSLLFVDEPSAGLDPVTARRLDELILELRDIQKSTFVIITHDLESIFTVGDQALFLDASTKRALPVDTPRNLRANGPQSVREFLTAGDMR